MASSISPTEGNHEKKGETRRSFLAKLGIGAAALALVSGSLSAVRGLGSNNNSNARDMEFPDEDSIFHPASDPRLDPRRRGQA